MFEQVDKTKAPLKFKYHLEIYPDPVFYSGHEGIYNDYWVKKGRLHAGFGEVLIGEEDSDLWLLFWEGLENVKMNLWEKSYCAPNVLDGSSWGLKLEYKEGAQTKRLSFTGQNDGPFKERGDSSGDCNPTKFIHKKLLRKWARDFKKRVWE